MESDGSYASSDEPKKKPNRGKPKKNTSASSTAKSKSKDTSLLKQKSPAEFFAENKNIAGFDNPGKSLYTTVREFVENSLDSAESISEVPSIEITIPHVFEGHPFMVEAGVSLGGKDVKQGINIFRFANRIPLLFEQGADVITRTALKRINWSSYKINQGQDKIGVFVSIVSTKIPFKGTGKEYIGDDITEIASAVQIHP